LPALLRRQARQRGARHRLGHAPAVLGRLPGGDGTLVGLAAQRAVAGVGGWRHTGGLAAKNKKTAPTGAVLIVNQIGLWRLPSKRWKLLI
jgi:hypothetical protein